MIRLSSVKKWDIHLNVDFIISNPFNVYLTNSFTVSWKEKWLVSSITADNSGWKKGKI